MTERHARVLVAGATGYVGRYAVQAFRSRGYWVRALTRNEERLRAPGPFRAPAIGPGDVDDVFVGELTDPATLDGVMDGIDVVFSSVGISRQRDRLSFEQVDHQCNHTLIRLAEAGAVSRFVYVSMQGADEPPIADLAITKAHEKVVAELRTSRLDHRVIRPCGYFSDMGALLGMARRGRVFLVGDGRNRMSPIHGRDLASVCVDALEQPEAEIEAGGPEVMTQREAAELAFEVLGKPVKITVMPLAFARALAKMIRVASQQYGDLADFILVAGEVDGVGPRVGTTTLRQHFEELAADPQAT